MNGKSINPQFKIEDRELAQYLLGELTEQQREGLEDRLFTGDSFEQLERVEEDLIEYYLRGRLRTNEKAHFEEHFMAFPRRRSRVEFTRALYEVLDFESVEGKRSAPAAAQVAPSASRFARTVRRVSTAAVGLALLGGGAWLGLEQRRLLVQQREPVENRNAPVARQSTPSITQQKSPSLLPAQSITPVLATPASIPTRIALPAFALALTGPTRGEADDSGERKLTLADDVHQFQLILTIPTSAVYRRFLASIQTPEGRQVAAGRARLIAPGKVSLILNADAFQTNDYILTLSGFMNAATVEEIADYSFRLIRQ